MKSLRIEIVTRAERNQALSLANDAIGAVEGWIVSHQLFSNMSATLIFELPATNCEKLLARLRDAGFKPTLKDDYPAGQKGDVRGNLVFTFIHDEPDMKRAVPAFG